MPGPTSKGEPAEADPAQGAAGSERAYDVPDCFAIASSLCDEAGRVIPAEGVAGAIPEPAEGEAALRESEQQLHRLIDNLPGSLVYQYVRGPDGAPRFLYISAGVERLNGVTPDEVLRDAGILHRQIDPEQMPLLIEAERRSAQDLSVLAMEVRMRRPDGQARWFRLHSCPRRLPGGQVVWDGVQTDITERKQMEEALRQVQQRFQTLAAATFEGIAISEAGRLLDVNEQFARMFGYEPAEMIGLQIADLITPEDRDRVVESIRANRDLNSPAHRCFRKDGTVFVIEAHARNIVHQGHNIRITAVRDITERMRAEEMLHESELKYRQLYESMTDAFVRVDMAGRIQEFNPAYRNMLGYSDEELRRLTYVDLTPEKWRALESRIVSEQIVPMGDSEVYEKEYRRKDGTVFPVELRTSLIRDDAGRPTAMWAIVRDITERKRAQETLEAARLAADSANAAKDQFLATLSHELRTPLTPVLMLSQMLQDDPNLPAAARQDLKTIRQNVQLEARLIDDLLDLTRITRGKIPLKPERVDVHELLRHAVQTCCDERFAEKRLQVEWRLAAASSLVSADPARLEQVFWNLINNAIKFTPPEGTITIRTSDLDEEQIRIQVMDTGSGIEPDKLKAIFDPFEQGGTETTGRYGGLGLGLAIAKAVTEMHGGAITAASDGPGRGATFTVTLAVAAAQEPAIPAASRPALQEKGPAAGPLRILLVEDHYTTAVVLGRLIQRWGWESSHAVSVKSALELAVREHFDLVLSDLGLPDGTGHDLMRRLRDLYGLKGIALSGYGMEQDVQRSLESGFVLHLTKPVDFEELRAAVAEFQLEARRQG